MAQTLRVVHEGGDRYRIRIDGHEVLVDQPVPAGGTDAGPTPTDLFVASLAACTAHYAGRFLRRHGIDATGLEVAYSFGSADRPSRVAFVQMDLIVPALPPGYEERLRAVVEHCTVKNSIAQAPQIGLRISARGQAPAA
jgi:putative redox protein